MSAAVWGRPIFSSTGSFMDWGFTETRSTLCFAKTAILSPSMVSGLPASTVNSLSFSRGRCFSAAVKTASSCSAERVGGGPPPM